MQAAPRRVRTIYSVIASPQRLEILKILNVKGPLTYSALKSLAGFKSKKESGKFAYHLRKLVRQLLIQLNRQERKYTVTNLGRLVLNLTRQIEEQSLIESGKLYVRTTGGDGGVQRRQDTPVAGQGGGDARRAGAEDNQRDRVPALQVPDPVPDCASHQGDGQLAPRRAEPRGV